MSLKDRIKKQRNFINLDPSKPQIERPNVNISDEHKRDIWKTIIRSHRAKAHTSSTTIINTSGKAIGTKKHITLSLFTEQKASSNVAAHVGTRTIERMDGQAQATSDIIELEHGYEQLLAIAKTPFVEELNHEIEQVFITDSIDPVTGESKGRYVSMSQEVAAEHRRKESKEYKVGQSFADNVFADPKNRELFAKFLETQGGVSNEQV